jgi:integrase/recombinase XerD
MPRPDKLPKVLTEAETNRLLSQPNQRYFSPHRDYLYMRLMASQEIIGSDAFL